MSKRWAAALTAFALAPAAYAGVGQGDFEAGISLSYSQYKTSIDQDNGFGGTCTTDTTVKSGSFGGNGGYFVTDMIEAKVAFTATRTGSETDGCGTSTSTPSSTLGVLSPGADFVFLGRRGKVSPFAGAAYGWSFGDTLGVDTDYVDVHAGAKFFISERASIEVKLTRFEPTDSAGDGRTELAAGINVYF